MGKLDEIRNKLQSGTTTRQLIEQGYSRSSVYREAKQLKVLQSDTPASPVSDEIQELRRHREIIKLQKEIADLEATKEKLPERVAALEKAMLDLRSLVYDSVDTAVDVCLKYAGMEPQEAHGYGDGWVKRFIKE